MLDVFIVKNSLYHAWPSLYLHIIILLEFSCGGGKFVLFTTYRIEFVFDLYIVKSCEITLNLSFVIVFSCAICSR